MSFKIELTTSADVKVFWYDFDINYGVVLAQWARRDGEWITWRVYPSREHEGKFDAEVGHYFGNNKVSAYADFQERIRYAA